MNYPLGASEDPLAPWNEPEPSVICENCGKELNEYESEDPCKINGNVYCDSCVSEVIAYGYKCRSVSEMTHDLAVKHFYNKILDTFPMKSVKHI